MIKHGLGLILGRTLRVKISQFEALTRCIAYEYTNRGTKKRYVNQYADRIKVDKGLRRSILQSLIDFYTIHVMIYTSFFGPPIFQKLSIFPEHQLSLLQSRTLADRTTYSVRFERADT